MRKFIFILLVSLLVSVSTNAQTTPATAPVKTTTEEKPKKQIFRANKDQITQVQKRLKVEETGKLNDATRAAVKKYQPENGLKATGTLNRATLEKMDIELTDRQKEMPVSPNSFASAETTDKPDNSMKPKRTIFRASKEQIMEAQKMLTTNKFYAGEATGKLDDATREFEKISNGKRLDRDRHAQPSDAGKNGHRPDRQTEREFGEGFSISGFRSCRRIKRENLMVCCELQK